MADEYEFVMGIETAALRTLAALMDESGLTEFELEENGRRLRLARGGQPVIAQAAPAPVVHHAAPPPVPATPSTLHHAGTVNSPMVGTAYLQPEPDKPAFVKIGDTVEAGATLLIIEAMKVMNPIKAPKAGRVTQIIVGDAQPVEFGEALMIIE